MVALSAVPLNSITWLVGSLACFTLGYKSLAAYRHSGNELSKYIVWFGFTIGLGQAILAVPTFFTANPETLRITYLAGEFFIYGSMVAQAAILWCLILRSRISIYWLPIAVGLIGLVSWLYALPNSTLALSGDFIIYRDPTFSTIVIGVTLMALFMPVGVYFLKSASQQVQRKAKMTSLVLGLVYVGIGLLTGGLELLDGQVMTRTSATPDLAFFLTMLVVFLWPRSTSRLKLAQ